LQPAWVDTHTVARPAAGINTVSTFSSSLRLKRNFWVPSLAARDLTTGGAARIKSRSSASRKEAGKIVIAVKLSAFFLYSHSKIC
jgi:hypothetical protein